MIAKKQEIYRLVGKFDVECLMKFKHGKNIYYSLSVIIEVIFRLCDYASVIPYEKIYKAT